MDEAIIAPGRLDRINDTMVHLENMGPDPSTPALPSATRIPSPFSRSMSFRLRLRSEEGKCGRWSEIVGARMGGFGGGGGVRGEGGGERL